MQIYKINILFFLLIKFSLYSSQDQNYQNINKNAFDLFPKELGKIISDYTIDWQLDKTIDNKEVSKFQAFAISPDGKYLAAGYMNGKIEIWSAETGNLVKDFFGMASSEYGVKGSLSFSQPDGQYLIESDPISQRSGIMDYKSDREYPFAHVPIANAVFSKNGKYIAGTRSANIEIFDTNNYELFNKFSNNTRYLGPLIFTPNNKFLAYSASPVTVIADINTSAKKYINEESSVSIDISSDSKFLATGGFGTAKVWDIETQKLIHTFLDTNKKISTYVNFSLDRKFFAAASGPILKIWDFNTKNLLKEIEEKNGAIIYMHFLPNNSIAYVLLSKENEQIKIWRYEGKEI